jgi:sugar/nucleoside kinase (ribokinase family)
MDTQPEVVTLGHPIVDVLAPSTDELVASLGLEKATMTLVDDDQAEKIYASLGPATEASGGSAANTAACLASLGGAVEFVGKVSDDGLGRVFTHDIRASGVRYEVRPASEGPGTGRCLIMVTPDAEKTMCTNLGIGAFLGAGDVDAAASAISGAKVVYLEGYLCGKPESAGAIDRAMSLAKEAGTLVAFSGSDPAWVALHLEELSALAAQVDILFANEEEARRLAQADDFDAALRRLSERGQTVAVTLGAQGSIVVRDGEQVEVPAASVDRVVDTTGAGDSFAAGFLFGLVNGQSSERCAQLGALAAAEVVSHLGARPLVRLADLATAAGLV